MLSYFRRFMIERNLSTEHKIGMHIHDGLLKAQKELDTLDHTSKEFKDLTKRLGRVADSNLKEFL